MTRAFVLGGTGLLGFETIKELLKRGYKVSTIARNKEMMDELIPEEVEKHIGDINEMTDEQIGAMLQSTDWFVHAAGVDERTTPEAPAVSFYYRENVLPTQRLSRIAREAGVRKFVIYGSYHVEFAEKWPDLGLKRTPYVRTRKLQEEVAMLEGEGEMDVMSLRLPYIFGTMPGRMPLWKMFLPTVLGKEIITVPEGATAMVTTRQVAEAGVGALEHGSHGGTYAISGENMSYAEFYRIIADTAGQKDSVIQTASLEQLLPTFEQIDKQTAEAGKERAMPGIKTAELQSRNTIIDPAETMELLKYKKDDVQAAIEESIRKSLAE
ncbi:NAD-dependent epimerase/dehydratase family protein [Aciduricibacillus chroicocephali]|uniref:NAD-dependent epimerase/dehydratase family protein n=1 Tax=Aciduricibacillus chroicocephali TaxID=3054939 RepID=A0ABY9KUZ1_9BACI|nr:NAD-dependent epimerase/dehydratase family protein [Bacillaceae bacterium 44XB]